MGKSTDIEMKVIVKELLLGIENIVGDVIY